MSHNKESIKKLIGENRLEEAIDILLDKSNAYLATNPQDKFVKEISNALYNNSGDLHGLKHEKTIGIIEPQYAGIVAARVRKALLDLTDQLPHKVFADTDSPKTAKAKETLWREKVKALEKTDTTFDFDVFLSFSSKDREEARKIWQKLRGYGLRVFLSDEALKAYSGMSFPEKINHALHKSRHFLLLCTPQAMQSSWVKNEYETFYSEFHIHQPAYRRFFIYETQTFAKKLLPFIYRRIQRVETPEEIIKAISDITLPEQKKSAQSEIKSKEQTNQTKSPQADTKGNKNITVKDLNNSSTFNIEQHEAKRKEEQEKLEQEAEKELRKKRKQHEITEKEPLITEYATTHGENINPLAWEDLKLKLNEKYEKIDELELLDLYDKAWEKIRKARALEEAEQQAARELERAIKTKIPALAGEFVEKYKGKWNHRKWIVFKRKIYNEYDWNNELKLAKIVEDEKAKYIEAENKRREFEKRFGKMVLVKGGTFLMGSEEYDEKPIHKVTVSDFYIAEKPVTQKLYKDITGKNPSDFKDCPECPVEEVTWYDAVKFCNALSKKAGLPPAYDTKHRLIDAEGWQTNDITKVKGYRLPTEAEWEYAAGGGQKSGMKSEDGIIQLQQYAGTNNTSELGDYAWYDKNSNDKTHPVGQKKPNRLDLYDMSGNVYEWCNDWYGENYYSESKNSTNPTGPSSGSTRVRRGGSWRNIAAYCRSALRGNWSPGSSLSHLGFRLVVVP